MPMSESRDPELRALAETVIRNAREVYSVNPDEYDWHTKLNGIERYGELWNQVHIIANSDHRAAPPDGGHWTEHELEERAAARKSRANELWGQVHPLLVTYADWCKRCRYTGWSREARQPLSRTSPISFEHMPAYQAGKGVWSEFPWSEHVER